MHVPNEHIFALPGSDHRTIARFDDDEDQRFSLVGMAVVELVEEALSCKQLLSLLRVHMLNILHPSADTHNYQYPPLLKSQGRRLSCPTYLLQLVPSLDGSLIFRYFNKLFILAKRD